MIVTLKGTSGTGKTTLVNKIMKLYTGKRLVFRVENRKQPIGYLLHHEVKPGPALAIIGHYETPCGGCDTISGYPEIFNLVRQAHSHGHDVLYEGLLIAAEVNYTTALHNDGLPIEVIMLNVPPQVCLDSVNARRQAKDPGKPPVNPKNTLRKIKALENTRQRLSKDGVRMHECDRDSAYEKIRSLLDV